MQCSDEIIRMAREAGLYVGTNISGVRLVGSAKNDNGLLIHMEVDELARFAALVAAAEREACAKVCDSIKAVNNDGYDDGWEFGIEQGAKECAAAIRARGETTSRSNT